MKVVGISGSPRRGGNTEMLLDKVLEGAIGAGASVSKVILNDIDFKGCQECGTCAPDGICKVKDEMQPVYEKIREADLIVIASPIFFGTISGQLKAMIDRFHASWVRKYILKRREAGKPRKGIFLSVSGADKIEFFENAKRIVKMFFNTLGIEYAGELFCGGLEGKGAVNQKKEALDRAFELGAASAK